MLKKWLLGILFAVLAIVFVAVLFVNRINMRALPDYDKDLKLEGLSGKVQVYRDAYAVPHIVAENEHDLYLATGYILAQDRLWHMDLLRRVTLGRLSEIFGRDLVEYDQLMRALQMTEKSREILANADPALKTALDKFAEGVNLYISEHSSSLPAEFAVLGYSPDPWEPVHSVNLIGYMAWDLTMPYSSETCLAKVKDKVNADMYAEVLPYPLTQKTTVFPASAVASGERDIREALLAVTQPLEKLGIQTFEGSNNWAVSGTKSTTGSPIFCNDMHLGLNAPGLWYQIQQTVPGALNVTGVLLPGQPFVIAGHNEDIAWGMTNVMVDDMDFYEEKLDESGAKYLYKNDWWKVVSIEETIGIKGGGDTLVVNRFTHRGPVISSFKGFDDKVVTMTWTGYLPSNELRSVYLLNRAGNWDEFRDAVETFRSVSQNVNYADRFGNIGLHNCAGIPIRPDGMTGLDIYPGWTDEFDWKGILPFEKQLYSFNPAEQYVSSANNKTAVNDYPYPVSHWFALHYRINRIREFIESHDKLSVEDMKTLQSDVTSHFVRDVKPYFLRMLAGAEDLSGLEKDMIARLERWDNTLTRESVEAAVFELTYVHFIRNMVADEMGEELYQDYAKNSYLARYFMDNTLSSGRNSLWADDVSTSDVTETEEDIVLASLRDALTYLNEEKGSNPDDWAWGGIHSLTLKHPLGSVKILDRLFHFNRGPFPAPGSFHTVAPYAYKLNDWFSVNHGASQRHIYTPDNWDNSFTVIPTGNSGISSSPHYCDQTELYMSFRYHPDYFSQEKVKEAAVYSMEFHP